MGDEFEARSARQGDFKVAEGEVIGVWKVMMIIQLYH